MLLETAKKGGWRFAAPLTAVLFIYSIVATWVAARQTKKAQELARFTVDSDNPSNDDASLLISARATTTTDSAAGGAAAFSSATQTEGPISADACPICHGRGTITWDRFDVNEGAICPRCLGTGAAKKRSTFFGR